ncbi:serine protease [Ruegeria sp. 2012CJ41-6]|uniref:Serine protease n=1 Tax=Ruegeria spongiae TaxID=2942209 RepID=A0ABT0Q3C8_9RHOB|nr:serine protease [Ruegeria spongiae]MCL6284380.1 serine protease [Ruegeria spongiae]
MIRFFVAFLLAVTFGLRAATAQQSGAEGVWVQIEAHSDFPVAEQRAQFFSGSLADVQGFALGGGWYGIMLGPYTRADAEQVLRVYRAERQIPSDSFLTFSRSLGRQFWPPEGGAVAVTTPAPTAPAVQTPVVISDETPAQARRSERQLSAAERRGLQTALKAEGFYNSTIDGAFGPGTRRSMADWQSVNGYEPTGILTTSQRIVLMDQYNAPLLSVGMARRSDEKAGISVDLPLGEVAFSRYDPPFAHYDAQSDLGARVLLISQQGERADLFGLYDVMQTLEIVPLDGPRQRRKDSFTIEGRGNGIVSYTEATLRDGQIKGFSLIWPEGDEGRRARVLQAIKTSFARTDGALDPAEGADAAQSVDLVSGLEIRKPRLSRSGFYVDRSGAVLTVAEAVQNCTRITLDNTYRADLVSQDEGLGVAILRPIQPLAPMAVAELHPSEPKLQSPVTLAGYSYEGVLGAPTLTFGTLSDVAGLRGEVELSRLALAPQEGDAGGPVFDTGGSVVGMLLPDPANGQQLPRDVSFAADAQALRNVLEASGLTVESASDATDITPDELNRRANGMTVLVSCWD